MIKKILVASLAVGALALGAPAAHAEHAQFDCGFDTIAQETATGGQDTFTGAAYGFIVSPTPGEQVSIQCWVRVDGARVDETPTGTGTNVATTADQVTYTATDTQDVDLCADWSAGSESGTTCFETTTTQIPPQEVIDLINSVFDLITQIEIEVVDPVLCPLLIQLDGVVPDVPGVVEINGQGDVFLAAEPFWDCPPYDLFPPEG